MNQQCKFCIQPRKPRKDRPGKFFTLCNDHYAEYQRKKNKESYQRYAEKRKADRLDRYWKDPDHGRKIARRWYQENPENHEKKKAYMRFYNSPYRIHLKKYCEADDCEYISRAADLRDMDIHHLDGDHSNDDPTNLQTLCSNCHRLVDHWSL